MRKFLLSVLIISLVFSSCRKDDTSLFEKSADQRITETLAAYQTQLSGAANGWKGLVTVDSGRGATYSFYFKFNESNRVTMYSDFDSASAVTSFESSYRLKALQQPSLIFDTYSYIHKLADPNDTISGGPRGVGLASDFEFAFDKVTTDSIILVGRRYGSKAVLIRATKTEADAFNNRQLGNSFLFNNLTKIFNYWKRITIGGVDYEVAFNASTRTITFSWLDANGTLRSFSSTFYYGIDGVILNTPFVNGSQIISGFKNIVWNAATITLTVSVNNIAATFAGANRPLKVDLTAPARWWDYAVNNGNDYWTSFNGFHVNGVDDAFNINSLVSGTNTYYFLIYWPKYAATSDFFGPIFLNAAQTGLALAYGSAPAKPTFTGDGRAIFTQLGNYGTYPTTGPAALSRNQLYNPSGYYFVQTGARSYDMVSAVDSKIWITWDF